MATRAWTEISPANSDYINQGAQAIRYAARDVRERMELDHIWNVSSSTDGYHNKMTMPNQGSRPSTASGYSKIWAEDSGSVSQPYMKDGAGNVRQLGVPVGAIVAYLPGYFTAIANVGYTGVSMTLPDGWVLCDGAAPNDANSPIWNTAARRVPDLDDARFLCGNTSGAGIIGVSGGVNTIPAHTGSTFASHTHTLGSTIVDQHNISWTHSVTQPTFHVTPHQHQWVDTNWGNNIATWDDIEQLNDILSTATGSNTSFTLNSTNYIYHNGEPPNNGFFTKTNTQIQCVAGVAAAVANHSTSITHATHTHTITSDGGAVTVGSDHGANSNMPAYLNVLYIIKIK